MHQDGNVPVGIQFDEIRLVLLESQQIDIMADELEAFLLQAQQRLHRVRNRLSMIKVRHDSVRSMRGIRDLE